MWKINEQTEWAALEERFEWVRDMNGIPQDAVHHAEGDVAVHTQMVLQSLEAMVEYKQLDVQQQQILFAAALLHDVEKRSTTVTEPGGSITSKGHAKKGAMTARRILYTEIPTPFLVREEISALVRFHGLPLWVFEKSNPVKAVIEASLQVNTHLLALLAKADIKGRICNDAADMLYRIELFQALCEENHCWGKPYVFASPNACFQYFRKEEAYPAFVPFDDFGSHVVMMSGLPGAGKDTYVKQQYKDWPIINLDDIRRQLKIAPTDKSGNGTVIQMAKENARVLLRQHKNFVWNATNITRQMREQLIELFVTYKAFVEIVYVEVPYKKLHTQNYYRDAAIPAAVIEKLIAKLEVPVLSEAHKVTFCIKE